jgi:predicted Zn-dependent protease
MENFKALFLAILAAIQGFWLEGCSTNPATGEKQFAALMSPAQEISVGAEEHPKILAEYGEYKNQAVVNYVRQIGAKVTQKTERPDVQYKFFVLDSPVVNAFALPGGYIYVSRGLLALANSEAELAAVLAHEAAHITARHSAERYSKGVVTSLGANILSAVIDQSLATQALGLGSDLYLKSYSRGQENEADTLGLRYMMQAGYDPQAMTSFLHSLYQQSNLEARLSGRDGSQISYFSTHPATADRVEKTAAEVGQFPKGGTVGQDEYLNMINGLTYGESPDQGFTRGRDFIHPGMGFAFTVPSGFTIENQPAQVVATAPSGAVIVFDMAPNRARETAANYLAREWMKGRDVPDLEAITINAMPSATAGFEGQINGRPMMIRLVAIEFAPDRFARFLMGIPANASSGLVEDLKRSTYSFRTLSAQDKGAAQAYGIKLVTAKAGDTPQSLSAQFSIQDNALERFMVLNALKPGEQITAGRRYKVVQ